MNFSRSLFGVFHPIHKSALLIADLGFIALAFYIAAQYRLNTTPDYYSLEYIGLNLVIVFSLFIAGSYTSSTLTSAPKLPLKTFFAALASALPCLLFIYFLGPERFTSLLGRGVFPVAILLFGLFSLIARIGINHLFRSQTNDQHIVLLGTQNAFLGAQKLLTTSEAPLSLSHSENINDDLKKLDNFNAVVIAPDHSPQESEQQVLINLRLAGLPIFSLSDFFENLLFLVPVQEINNDWFIRAEGFTMLHSSVAARLKRIVDILVASLFVVLSAPISVICACLIKLSSPGPIFFSQKRVGVQGKGFTLYKFRTMHINAETDGAQWASDNDPRIFKLGHLLRKTRIDEIPQCWNILKGEMSIIGPRPERPEFTSMLAEEIPYYDLRHVIKPGLTGWAQVNYPYGASTEDALRKLQFDLYYVKNYSLLLDLNIMLRTILTVFRRDGR